MSRILSSNPALVDFSQRSLYISALSIAFNPTFWNTVARREYHHKTLTRLFNGNSQRACYALALTIFSLGLFRDALYLPPPSPPTKNQQQKPHRFERALRSQPTHPALQHPLLPYLAYALIASGNILVLSSTYALGITGTYLGDYFGILMEEPVTSFPFNVTGAPMYYGSTMSFLGTALLYASPAGVALAVEVLAVYWVALGFEE
ncbi:MAG: hypothetical protein L6R40_002543 [Gallowayella cf. fulva]|nr:MAG: hypothetical protein L6R40_002543 [Xanthomendoza cf. fulva]